MIALPGNYTVKLTANGQTATAPLEVGLDPRLKISAADLQKQFDLAMKINDLLNQANTTANQILDLRSQLDDVRDRVTSASTQAKQLTPTVEQLDKHLDTIENQIIQPKSHAGEDPLNYPIKVANKLLLLQGTVEGADTSPTQAQYTVYDLLSQDLNNALAEWRQVTSTELATLNSQLQQANITTLYVTQPRQSASESAVSEPQH